MLNLFNVKYISSIKRFFRFSLVQIFLLFGDYTKAGKAPCKGNFLSFIQKKLCLMQYLGILGVYK